MQNIVNSTGNRFKNINEILDILFFHTKFLKFGGCFILVTHFSLNVKFSWEMLDLYLDLIKFRVEKVHSHTQVFPDI